MILRGLGGRWLLFGRLSVRSGRGPLFVVVLLVILVFVWVWLVLVCLGLV